MPMMLASLIPAPSCGSKTFISARLLSGKVCRQTTPGVRVPSTSIRRTRIGFARRITLGGYFISRIVILSSSYDLLRSPPLEGLSCMVIRSSPRPAQSALRSFFLFGLAGCQYAGGNGIAQLSVKILNSGRRVRDPDYGVRSADLAQGVKILRHH